MGKDLVNDLRGLACHEHDDHSIAEEAANELERLYNNKNLIEEEAYKLSNLEELRSRVAILCKNSKYFTEKISEINKRLNNLEKNSQLYTYVNDSDTHENTDWKI